MRHANGEQRIDTGGKSSPSVNGMASPSPGQAHAYYLAAVHRRRAWHD